VHKHKNQRIYFEKSRTIFSLNEFEFIFGFPRRYAGVDEDAAAAPAGSFAHCSRRARAASFRAASAASKRCAV
jgi:hypothetical protein